MEDSKRRRFRFCSATACTVQDLMARFKCGCLFPRKATQPSHLQLEVPVTVRHIFNDNGESLTVGYTDSISGESRVCDGSFSSLTHTARQAFAGKLLLQCPFSTQFVSILIRVICFVHEKSAGAIHAFHSRAEEMRG